MHLSATWMHGARVNLELGVTSPSVSAPATVTSLKTDPGSKTSVTAWFVRNDCGTCEELFAL